MKSLPDKFEYGMNRFLDRIAELYGENAAQKTYEELKKKKKCTIEKDTSVKDVAGIPVLFSVMDPDATLDALYTTMARMGAKNFSVEALVAEQLKRAVASLKKEKGEQKVLQAARLFVTYAHFMNLTVDLRKRGDILAAKATDPEAEEMKQIAQAMNHVAGETDIRFISICIDVGIIKRVAEILGTDVRILHFPQEFFENRLD